MAVSIYNPMSSLQGFHFPPDLHNLVTPCLFVLHVHSNKNEEISHCAIDSYFPKDSCCGAFFMDHLVICISSLKKKKGLLDALPIFLT